MGLSLHFVLDNASRVTLLPKELEKFLASHANQSRDLKFLDRSPLGIDESFQMKSALDGA